MEFIIYTRLLAKSLRSAPKVGPMSKDGSSNGPRSTAAISGNRRWAVSISCGSKLVCSCGASISGVSWSGIDLDTCCCSRRGSISTSRSVPCRTDLFRCRKALSLSSVYDAIGLRHGRQAYLEGMLWSAKIYEKDSAAFKYAPHTMAALTSTQVHIAPLIAIDIQVSFPVSTRVYFKRSPETIVTLFWLVSSPNKAFARITELTSYLD